MTPQEEIQIREMILAARQSGDVQAEISAREKLLSPEQQTGVFGLPIPPEGELPKTRKMFAETPEEIEAQRAGVGKVLVDIGRGVKQLFVSPQESQRIAEQTKEEDILRQRMYERGEGSPEFFQMGRAGGTVLAAMAPLKAPLPATLAEARGALPLLARTGASGAMAGAVNVAQPTAVEGEEIPWYSPQATTKAGQFGKGFAVGSVLQTAFEGARKAAPTNILLKNKVEKYLKDPRFAPQKESYENFLKAGGDISDTAPSQVFGAPKLAGVEGAVAKTTTYADDALNVTVQGEKNALDKVMEFLDKFGTKVRPEAGHRMLKQAQYAIQKDYEASRHAQAFLDYGAAKKAIQQAVGDAKAPIVGSNNYTDELEKIATQYGQGYGQRTAAAAMLKQARAMRNSVRNLDDAVQFRSYQNDIAAGRKSAFGISKDEAGEIGKRLSDAITKDIEAAADAIQAPQVKTLLQKANANYRVNSQKIADVEDTVLGKILNARGKKPVEAFTEAMDTAHPTQLAKQVRYIEEISPRFAGQAKRMYVERMINRSLKGPAAMATEANLTGEAVDIGKFAKELKKEEVLNVLFKNSGDRKFIKDIADNLSRKADLAGKAGAAQTLQTESASAVHATVTGDIGFVARYISIPIFRRKMYKALFTPEGRKALYQFSRPDPRMAASGLAALNNLFQAEEETE